MERKLTSEIKTHNSGMSNSLVGDYVVQMSPRSHQLAHRNQDTDPITWSFCSPLPTHESLKEPPAQPSPRMSRASAGDLPLLRDLWARHGHQIASASVGLPPLWEKPGSRTPPKSLLTANAEISLSPLPQTPHVTSSPFAPIQPSKSLINVSFFIHLALTLLFLAAFGYF